MMALEFEDSLLIQDLPYRVVWARLQDLWVAVGRGCWGRSIHGCGPTGTGKRQRIDLPFEPPASFIAMIMQLTMMQIAQWDGKLVTNFAAECIRLGKGHMMGMSWLPATDGAGGRCISGGRDHATASVLRAAGHSYRSAPPPS
jgi:hypothetical protein